MTEAIDKARKTLADLEASEISTPDALTSAMLNLAWELIRSNASESRELSLRVEARLAGQAPGSRSHLCLLRVKTELAFQLGQFPESLAAAEEGLEYRDHPDWSDYSVVYLTNIGRSHALMGRYSEALPYFLELHQQSVKTEDRRLEASCLNNMGLVCCSIGDLETANRFFTDALVIYEDLDDPVGQCYIYNNRANHPFMAKEPGETLIWAEKACSLALESGRKRLHLIALDTLGTVLLERDELDRARSVLEEAVSQSGDLLGALLPALVNLSTVFLRQGNLSGAEQSLSRAIPLADKQNSGPERIRCHRLFAELREAQGRHREALELRKLYEKLRDEVYGITENQRVRNLQVVYETKADRLERALLKHKASELETLARVGREIHSSLDPETVLQHIADSALSLLDASVAAIFLLDSTGKELNATVVTGDRADVLKNLVVPVEGSLAGSVCITGGAEIIEHPDKDPRIYMIPDEGEHELNIHHDAARLSILTAALHSGEAAAGTIQVWKDKHEKGSFKQEQLDFLVALAQQASSALHNSTLFIQLQEAKDKAEDALAQVKTLKGLVPICANCKSIRDDEGFWHNIAEYISKHSEAEFSHGICPSCIEKHFSDLPEEEGENPDA